MIVKCIKVDENEIIIKDKEYIVFGLVFYHGKIEYILQSNSYYPLTFNSKNFILVDNEIPNSWIFNQFLSKTTGENIAVYSYKEFALNFDSHYEKVFDGDEIELEIYNHRKEEILTELTYQKYIKKIGSNLDYLLKFKIKNKNININLYVEEYAEIEITNFCGKMNINIAQDSGKSWYFIEANKNMFKANSSLDNLMYILEYSLKWLGKTSD